MADFEINPFAISEPINTKVFSNLIYTNQDFWSLKSALLSFTNEEFKSVFNDFVESSIAVMLIENFAFLGDTISFKMDQIANEIFIDTVVEIENAFRLADLVGFRPLPPLPATALCSAVSNSLLSVDTIIPTPFEIDIGSADGNIVFELFPADSKNRPIFDEDIIIPAGETTITNIIAVEGRTTQDVVLGNGTSAQTIELVSSPVINNSVRVFVNGVEWEQVDFFTDSQRRREFRVEFSSDYSAFVIFGDTRAGLIPAENAEIIINYRVGGGIRGNVVTGAINAQRGITIPVFPFASPVTFTNYTRGENGYDGDTVEDIRRELPKYIRTQDRAVTGEDYKTLADQFASDFNGQIGKSVAALREHGCAANVIDLFILEKNGENDLMIANAELKVELQDYIDSKKMFTDHVCIRDGIIISTDVSVDVTLERSRKKFEEENRERIQRQLDVFFALANWEYGQDLKDTDIIKTLSTISEILDFNITFTTDDDDNGGQMVVTKFNEIIRPDDFMISFTYI
jgi:hypothetical protein